MLLVNNRQTEILKGDGFLNQRMRTHTSVDFTAGHRLM